MRGGEHVGIAGVFVGGVRFRWGCDVSGRRWRFAERVGRGDNGPAVYGPAGIRAAAMWWKSLAAGHAAAKARRTREAVSMTRVPSFNRRRRMVANSAVASACVAGMVSRIVRISQ